MLGLNQSFYRFASTESFTCKCSVCVEFREGEGVEYYESRLRRMRKQKKIMGSRLMLMKGEQSSATPSYLSENGRDVILFKSVCSNSYFRIMQSIRNCLMPKEADYYRRLLFLEARMGHIEYSLLEAEDIEALEEPICLRVHILSSEEEFIDIRLR